MIESEKDIERFVCKAAKDLGGLAIKTNAINHKGVPDRLILLPGGKVGFLELKTTGKKPTKLQEYWLSVLSGLGFAATWVDSKNKATQFLDDLKNA